jgi:uncharacterized protein (DUF362 family)
MIRWKCNSCNKVWIYPIKKCFYCKGNIDRIDIKPKKIIGITKVTVPSPLHPIVPYNILLLEDEGGNRIPRKTMKEYRVGGEFIEEKAKTDNAVSIVKTKYDIYDAIKNALELINFEISSSSKILIKPNIVIAAYPYQTVCTNPRVVEAIIKLLLDKGINKENISVGEQSVFGEDTIKAATKSGILSVCKKYNINFIDLSKTEFEERTIESYKFKISREVLNKDLIINVPVLKTHSQLGISGALENMTRVVNVETQKEMSKTNPDEQIACLSKYIQYLTIADGTIGMQGTGPFLTGEPSFLNLILASRDPVALDTVFCELGMFDIPAYIKTASKVGVGNSNLKEIEIVGYELEATKLELKKPSKNLSPNLRVNVIDGRSWSGEYYALYSILNRFGNSQIKKANIVVGGILNKEILPKERLIAFGDDAIKKLKELGIASMAEIKGDPPDLMESYILLKKLLMKEGEVRINIFDQAKSKIMSKIKKIGG